MRQSLIVGSSINEISLKHQLNLEMDPKVKAEFSVSIGEELEMTSRASEENNTNNQEKVPSVSASASASNLCSGSSLVQGEETLSKRGESIVFKRSSVVGDRGRNSSAHSKGRSGKKKVKVDWTPELHRQFVQAVEQLGLDKAVPSRILELMGNDCLTRHNVASHLQKYRSHRKHLLAREAEAASWRRRRQVNGPTGSGARRRDVNACAVSSTGFPSVSHFTPLHVWGHPSADQSLMYMWPNHLASSSPPSHAWAPLHLPLGDPSFWYSHYQNVPAPGMPCFPPHFSPPCYPTLPVPVVPSASMYRVDHKVGVPYVPTRQTLPQPPFDFHPSNESIDAVIGDALSKPWLPLPLGLKAPSTDSVMVELERQGIRKIPPTRV